MEKVPLKGFHLNSQTVRFHPQTPNLELQMQLIPLVLARCDFAQGTSERDGALSDENLVLKICQNSDVLKIVKYRFLTAETTKYR